MTNAWTLALLSRTNSSLLASITIDIPAPWVPEPAVRRPASSELEGESAIRSTAQRNADCSTEVLDWDALSGALRGLFMRCPDVVLSVRLGRVSAWKGETEKAEAARKAVEDVLNKPAVNQGRVHVLLK